MAILLFFFVFQMLYKKHYLKLSKFKKKPVLWTLAALFVVFLLASIFSVDPYFSFWGSPVRSGGLVTFAFYFILAILTFIFFRKDDWKKAWNFSIIVGVLVSLVAIIQYFGLFSNMFLSVSDRPPSTMGNPIMLAMYLLFLSFLTLSFAIKEKNKNIKILYSLSFLMFLYTILITGSRAVYLGIFIGIIYFFLFYPKKIKALKTAVICLLILAAGAILYANTINRYPQFLENNRLFKSVTPRLSISLLTEDPRFYAWGGVDYKIILEKPVLGYGPENFSVGFDKHYDPAIPYLNKSWGGWWDRAHNIIIQTGSDAGILGIIAYILFFVVLFWQLNRTKSANKETNADTENTLTTHGIQATIVGYLVANLFSFDAFGSYFMFFLLTGYSLYLISSNNTDETPLTLQKNGENKNSPFKFASISLLFLALVTFLWQYNFVPLKINAQINVAGNLTDQKKCEPAINLMDKILLEHSFLDSYVRLKYAGIVNQCVNQDSNLTVQRIQKAITALKENAKIMPTYTRNWYFLGAFTNALIEMDFAKGDPKIINDLKNQADYYFTKALELSPKRQEIFLEWSKAYLLLKDYPAAIAKAQACVELNPGLGDCYWSLAVAKIFSGDVGGGEDNIKTAKQKSFPIDSFIPLNQLLQAYHSISNYEKMIMVYKNLITLKPSELQYYASLATTYKELKDYKNARATAEMILKLSPGSKASVESFLNTLPW